MVKKLLKIIGNSTLKYVFKTNLSVIIAYLNGKQLLCTGTCSVILSRNLICVVLNFLQPVN